MNEFLNRKQFVCALIEVLNLGVTHFLDEDSEILLRALRVLRPTFQQLATFDALLAIHRGNFQEGIRALADLDAVAPTWLMGKALLAVCKFGVDDPSWTVPANEVLAADGACPAADFVRTMLGHALPEAAGAPSTGWPPMAHGDPRMAQYAGFGMV
jgi:type III secretion protein HrpB1